jgi:hypothetical protein
MLIPLLALLYVLVIYLLLEIITKITNKKELN